MVAERSSSVRSSILHSSSVQWCHSKICRGIETWLEKYPKRDEVNTQLASALELYPKREGVNALVVGVKTESAESVVNSQKLMTNLMETKCKGAFEKLVIEKLGTKLKEIEDKVAIQIAELK